MQTTTSGRSASASSLVLMNIHPGRSALLSIGRWLVQQLGGVLRLSLRQLVAVSSIYVVRSSRVIVHCSVDCLRMTSPSLTAANARPDPTTNTTTLILAVTVVVRSL